VATGPAITRVKSSTRRPIAGSSAGSSARGGALDPRGADQRLLGNRPPLGLFAPLLDGAHRRRDPSGSDHVSLYGPSAAFCDGRFDRVDLRAGTQRA